METNGNGTALPQSGLYRHKETGAETVLKLLPELGSSQIDAFIRAGFERVGDVPTITPETVKK
jgi:hypothetical protein